MDKRIIGLIIVIIIGVVAVSGCTSYSNQNIIINNVSFKIPTGFNVNHDNNLTNLTNNENKQIIILAPGYFLNEYDEVIKINGISVGKVMNIDKFNNSFTGYFFIIEDANFTILIEESIDNPDDVIKEMLSNL